MFFSAKLGDPFCVAALAAVLAFVCPSASSPMQGAGKPKIPAPAVQCIAIDRDGATLAMATAKGELELWKTSKLHRFGAFQIGTTAQTTVLSMKFAPDGKTIAIARQGGLVQIWDLKKGELKVKFEAHARYTADVVFSQDGMILYSCGADNFLRAWRASTGGELAARADVCAQGSVNNLGLALGGELLASGSFSGEVGFWETKELRRIQVFPDNGTIYSIAVSPDGKRILSGGTAGPFLWDAQKRTRIGTYVGAKGQVGRLAFSPNSAFVLAEDSQRTLTLWDAKSFEKVSSVTFDGVHGCVFTPNSKELIGCDKKGVLHVWRTPGLTEVKE